MTSSVATPEKIARKSIAAENAGDVDRAMSLFAADPDVRSSMGTFSTTAEVRGWQRELADNDLHIEPGKIAVEGNRAYWDGTIAIDPFRQLGLDRLDGTWEIVVDGGEIVEFVFSLTPDSLTVLQAAMAEAAGS